MKDLILVPTPAEMQTLRQYWAPPIPEEKWAMQVCGFGPIAAAARAAALISRYKPTRVILLGIAGTFDEDHLALGTACRFDAVTCHGIGVGNEPEFQSAESLGWMQFRGGDAEPEIGDRILLDSAFVSGIPSAGTLLTCCSASAHPAQSQARQAAYPDVVAEDMEGYGVALACGLALVPLQIVRGISNVVGEREPTHWKIEPALEAATRLAIELAARPWLPSPA